MDEYMPARSLVGTPTIEEYIEWKIKTLRRDFKIEPTAREMQHIYSLRTEIAVDNAVLKIINDHWRSELI